MSEKIAAVELSDRILFREDFQQDFGNLEQLVAGAFLAEGQPGVIRDEAVHNLLRYADVLSHSAEPTHRELAYTTIALLREYDEIVGLSDGLKDRMLAVAEAILIELGNFPGIQTLQKGSPSKYALPLSRGTLRIAKEVLQSTSRRDATFTDAQYAIAESLREQDFFSFSGPTSLGKSFIIKDALYEIVRRDELSGHCIVVLVPTKALIGQTANDLRELLEDAQDVNVATFPALPRLLQQKYGRTIFVLTPERLLRYLARPSRQIDYLVVDEAQKIIAKNDPRSSLYYHAIVETVRAFATKLVFSAPSINNPKIFLELFGKSTNGSLAIRERTVAQQRFFVDLVDRRQYHFSALGQDPRELESKPMAEDVVDLVVSRSGSKKAIIYVNGSEKSSKLATQLAQRLAMVSDSKTSDLIKHVQEYVHKEYFLGRTLERGVAFHHGKMPQEIRERVEAAFANPNSPLQFVVCTSTLLEGVNLPAKNIFILSDKHGSRNFSKIDFENLVGRAGRLTYDFSGNVIVVRAEEGRWVKTRSLIPQAEPETAESFLVQPDPRRRKEYTDIARVLRGEELPGKPSADQRRSVQQYASILTLHQIDQQQTPLRSFFLDKIDGGRELLGKVASSIEVPTEVLRRAPDILPEYQDKVWAHLRSDRGEPLLREDANLDDRETFYDVLSRLSELYNWKVEESRGRDPLLPSPRSTSQDGINRRLQYWAMLTRTWVRGDALSQVIANAISYFSQRGKIQYRDYTRTPSLVEEDFDPSSAIHINIIIEKTLRDIEGGLRFRIISYLQNFYDISVLALGGEEAAGINVATLVEYGTNDPLAIELQEIGFSRGVATELLTEYSDLLRFSNTGELEEIDEGAILASEELSEDAHSEMTSILVKRVEEAT